jgi:hypothetical protein
MSLLIGICEIYQANIFYHHQLVKRIQDMPWRRGAVDIPTASGARRPGFESRQGIRFLGKHSRAVVYKMTHCLCVESRNKGIVHNIKSFSNKNLYLHEMFFTTPQKCSGRSLHQGDQIGRIFLESVNFGSFL